MRLSNHCCVLLHISHRLSIFKTDDLTALPLLASVVCLLACKSFIISPTIWDTCMYMSRMHTNTLLAYIASSLFLLLAMMTKSAPSSRYWQFVEINSFCQSRCTLSRTAEPTTLDRQHSSSIGVSVTSLIMLSPLSSHPEQRADLVAKYLDDVSRPMACGVPVVLK